MKAILLSAGSGRRLHPHTLNRPTSMLPVLGERTILDVQLDALASHGVNDVAIMVGSGADLVDSRVRARGAPRMRARTIYNPFHGSSSDLMTCWLASGEMAEDFILLDGDTVFEPNVLSILLANSSAPLTVTVAEKSEYQDDDVKVRVEDGRLLELGEGLDPDLVAGESIGMMLFRGSGVAAFRCALSDAVRDPGALGKRYLSAVDSMTDEVQIETASITGNWWGEVRSPAKLAAVRAGLEQLEKLEANGTYGQPGRVRIRR